jgi:hypothetical protein
LIVLYVIYCENSQEPSALTDGGGLVEMKLVSRQPTAKQSDTTTLLRAATVVRHGRHISNHIDADTQSGERTN